MAEPILVMDKSAYQPIYDNYAMVHYCELYGEDSRIHPCNR